MAVNWMGSLYGMKDPSRHTDSSDLFLSLRDRPADNYGPPVTQNSRARRKEFLVHLEIEVDCLAFVNFQCGADGSPSDTEFLNAHAICAGFKVGERVLAVGVRAN